MRLVRHVEISRQRLADFVQLDLEFIDQHGFDVEILAACRARRQLQLLGRDDRVRHQVIVLALDPGNGLLALAKRDSQGFRNVRRAFFHERRERLPALGIDDLHNADQFLGLRVYDRRGQHLLGAIAGLDVHLLQEIQLRAVGLEFLFVVDVADVDHLLMHRDKAGDTLLCDRQLQVLERVKPGLDLRDDGCFVFAHQIEREPVGVEEAADVLAQLQHDFVYVAGGVDAIGDRLQGLGEIQLLRQVVLRDRLGFKYATHGGLTSHIWHTYQNPNSGRGICALCS